MLMVLFQLGEELYALDSRDVIEIVPSARLKELPHAPDYVCGLFQYRGTVVPVLDLNALMGNSPCRKLLSTRIILSNYVDAEGEPHILGLMVERVTDMIETDEHAVEGTGIKLEASPYLGGILRHRQELIHCIRLKELLPPSVRNMLFQPLES